MTVKGLPMHSLSISSDDSRRRDIGVTRADYGNLSLSESEPEPVVMGSSMLNYGRRAILLLLLVMGAVVVIFVTAMRHPADFGQPTGGSKNFLELMNMREWHAHWRLQDPIGGFLLPYGVDPTCPDDDGVCLCHIEGTFKKTTLCTHHKYQVGDVIFFENPGWHFWFLKYYAAYVSSLVQMSPIIHVAMVVSVPPPGTLQDPKNIILGESISPQGIAKSTLQYVISRFAWGRVHIRRVDPVRFPHFHKTDHLMAIQHWTHVNIMAKHYFDNQMINPLIRKSATGERYIPIDPTCPDMKRALEMYRTNGQILWMCSEFVAWTLAFAGGLNTDYGEPVAGCSGVKTWTIKNLQPFPGELFKDPYNIFEAGGKDIFCAHGCLTAKGMKTPHEESGDSDKGKYASRFSEIGAVEYNITTTTTTTTTTSTTTTPATTATPTTAAPGAPPPPPPAPTTPAPVAPATPYTVLCSNCQCGGKENVDWKNLGAAATPDACYSSVTSDTFCGNEFIIGGGTCYCRAPSHPCSQEARPNNGWVAYQAQAQPIKKI